MRSARVELILDTLKAIRGARDFTKATDDVADSLGETAREGKKAAKAIDDVGDEMSDAARAAKSLDKQIEDLTASLAGLAIAETLTGENFSKQMREQETQLSKLTKTRKQIGNVGDDSGKSFVQKFRKQLDSGLTSLPMTGWLSVPVVAAGASIAPLLGAVISGGILGGVGIGGVVGGLSVAAQDSRVQEAIETLGGRVEARLQRAGGGFVQPALKGLHEVQMAADDIDIEGIFEDSEKFVDPLARSVTSLVTDLADGVEDLVANAGPSVSAISTGITEIGHSLGDGLSGIAANGDAAAEGLTTLLGVVNSATQTTFMLVNALTELYGISQAIGGDMVLKTFLKLTGAEMDNTGFSAHTAGAETKDMGDQMQIAADKAAELKEQQKELKVYTDAVKGTQDDLKDSLDALGGSTSRQAQVASGLATAMDNLYGAAIRNTDANEAYQASFDSLSETVKGNADQFKHNRDNLDLHTKAGRENRDALEALLTSSNELYISDVNAGVATDVATGKHAKRTEQVRKEARQLGLNKDETQKLITTYGRIPGKKATDLVLDGVREIIGALKNLYVYQRALATGKSISSVEDTMRKGSDKGPSKAGGGFSTGGWTGPGEMHDPAGVVHADEFVIRKSSRQKIERQKPGFLDELNATGQLPGYAGGGSVAPVDTSRTWPFHTDVSGTKVPTRAQVAAKVAPSFGNWPSSPSAQRGDSGVWRSIVALIRSTGPLSGSFGNAYRPGDPLWHGSGRAVDWMGFNQDRLATFLANRRPLELIHRTKHRDYAYTRGRNKGSFNESLMNAHRNHVHIAMQNGGVIPEPVFGVGRSGRSYSFAENGRPERVLSAGQTAAGVGAPVTYAPVINIYGANKSPREIASEVDRKLGRAVDVYARGGGR